MTLVFESSSDPDLAPMAEYARYLPAVWEETRKPWCGFTRGWWWYLTWKGGSISTVLRVTWIASLVLPWESKNPKIRLNPVFFPENFQLPLCFILLSFKYSLHNSYATSNNVIKDTSSFVHDWQLAKVVHPNLHSEENFPTRVEKFAHL